MGDNIGGVGGKQAIDTALLSEDSEEEGAAHQQRLEVVQLQKGDNMDDADEEQSFDTILPGGPEEEEEEGAAHRQRLEVAQRQMGDNICGADEEQSIDTVVPWGYEEEEVVVEEEGEEGATQLQRLEVVQRQQGDNVGDTDGIAKPLPMRPYPVAGDDTSAGDPVTPESDYSGKDERNDHQPAIASAPSPQVTDDSAADDPTGTSVGGSGRGHTPKLPSTGGMEMLGNEFPSELDATDDSTGTSVGGTGVGHTPKLPSSSGMELLGSKMPTELDGTSISRDSSTGGVPVTSLSLLSTSPAPPGHRAAIAVASSPQATRDSVGTSVGGSGRVPTPKLRSQKSGMNCSGMRCQRSLTATPRAATRRQEDFRPHRLLRSLYRLLPVLATTLLVPSNKNM
ncbi:hypothetical protein Esi_0173_0015 [Ectocarpus siliculosus]|uniref:Uncharacterized protein n=1 Tax=Ectocarpus siliculosus TaxID=2880 RepID=D7FN11_ECTSI|nr:hypothetical protein Esi_0173_0015 [Ectocarpus siliculosus]|eukprot:CBJ30075.1 hypothetical protein Esi_0173_0015 [Ectocarpus siliculosus]